MDRTQQYIDDLKSTLDGLNRGQLNAMIDLFFYAQREQKQIFTFGNGGSGATASHAAGDFIKGASFGLEKRFRMICLNDNIPSMMAIANDTSWSEIFVEALKNYLNPGDVAALERDVAVLGTARTLAQDQVVTVLVLDDLRLGVEALDVAERASGDAFDLDFEVEVTNVVKCATVRHDRLPRPRRGVRNQRSRPTQGHFPRRSRRFRPSKALPSASG